MDIEEIRRCLKKPGKTQVGLAEAMGIHPSGVNRILKGKRQIKAYEVPKMAMYLEPDKPEQTAVEASHIPGLAESARRPLERPKGVIVIDYVEAGDWRETSGFAYEDQYLVPVFDDRYKSEDLFGIEVRGDSMDEKYDEGTILICRKFDPMVELPPVGKDVIVRRRSAEGLIERTVKSLETDEHGRGWLVPKSSNDEWKPEEFCQKGDGDELDIDTEIIGVVLWDMRKHD